MITVTVMKETTVNGQTVKESVTLTADFPADSQSSISVDDINKLREELEQTKQSLQNADKRNKPPDYT